MFSFGFSFHGHFQSFFFCKSGFLFKYLHTAMMTSENCSTEAPPPWGSLQVVNSTASAPWDALADLTVNELGSSRVEVPLAEPGHTCILFKLQISGLFPVLIKSKTKLLIKVICFPFFKSVDSIVTCPTSGPQPGDLCNNEVGMPTILGSAGGWPGFTDGWPIRLSKRLPVDWYLENSTKLHLFSKSTKISCVSLVFRWFSLWLYHFVG